MEQLRGFRLVDVRGRPLAPTSIHPLECLNGEDTPGRQAHLVEMEGRRLLLKIRRPRGVSTRLGFASSGSYTRREAERIEAAAAAGIPVAAVAARGWLRRWGLVLEEALLIEWLDGKMALGSRVRQARAAGDTLLVDRARKAMVRLLADIRRRGLADKDFGVHNLLVPDGWPDAGDLVWVDLERAFAAAPDDRGATCQSVAAALARWWAACDGQQDEVETAFREIRERLPEPCGGWSGLLEPMNRTLMRRVIGFQEIDRCPAPLTVPGRPEEAR